MTTNLQILKPSRTKPKPGDVFALKISQWFLFGRVISTEAKAGWTMKGATLIYIFTHKAQSMEVPARAELKVMNLLVPPIMTNTLPWSRGYFQTLQNISLAADEVLAAHCFQSSGGQYFNEHAIELASPVDPCGEWGLHSYRTIDDRVSEALGIAAAL